MNKLDQIMIARGSSVAALVDELELRRNEVAYASGSVVDGLGDEGSNIDVFILTDAAGMGRRRTKFSSHRALEQTRRGFGIIYLRLAEMPCDIEVHSMAIFERLLAAIDELRLDDPELLKRSEKSLGPFDAAFAHELLHRLHIGIGLGSGVAFARFARRLDVQKYLGWRLHGIDIDLRDLSDGIERNTARGDLENAFLLLRQMYHRLADRMICLSGQSLDRPKWRLPKLRRLKVPTFLRDYLDVHFGMEGQRQTAQNILLGLARARA